MSNPSDNSQTSEPLSGMLFAVAAYFIWGFLPLYLKTIGHIPAIEVVAHRILWSVPVAGALILWLGRTADLRAAFKSPRVLLMATLTAALISINWGIYIWAIAADRAVEGALGYYINPILNMVLGVFVLGERLSRLQILAVVCAVIAVAILTFGAGGLPWVSLALAGSFGIYGFLRKTLPIGPTQGFLLEVLILSIPALFIITWFVYTGTGHFGPTGLADIGLLLFAGPVTAIPLILYAFGAKALRYTTVGILQYIAPTMIFLIAVFVFKEPFSHIQLIAFCFIWTGLALYTWSMFKKPKKKPAPLI